MGQVYITEVNIENVRHLQNIRIAIEENSVNHLMITGKNGSGKTSVLHAMKVLLNALSTTENPMKAEKSIKYHTEQIERLVSNEASENAIAQEKRNLKYWQEQLEKSKAGIDLTFNIPKDSLRSRFEDGEFILACYEAEREFESLSTGHIEKVELKDRYGISEKPRTEFIKYLADLRVTEALALSNHKKEKALKIQRWFHEFETILKEVFDDEKLQLVFDEDKFDFYIKETGKQEYNFNVLSSGYAAILDIVSDLIMRMEKHNSGDFLFEQPGIVLVDEIETHLHLELQKRIMPLLTRIFPNIQFIVTTHSPFILNSISNVVIYDLERKLLVKDGLTNMPYEGVVEGYFQSDKLSVELKQKFEQYKKLAYKEYLDDEDIDRLDKLELYLDEIPDYLGLDIATEYLRIKLNLRERTDV